MNKKNHKVKSNNSDIKPIPRESIAEIRGEEDFVEFLRRELEWPIPIHIDRLEDVVISHNIQYDFGFPLEEDRISVSRLFNLSEDQPWGIFLFEFQTDRPYLTHLRRLLRVLGSERTRRRGDPIWDRNDLLFICTRDWNEYHFVHFSGEKPETALISSFGWQGPDDPFLYTLCKHNLPKLRMPTPRPEGGYIAKVWRDQWSESFNIKPVTDDFYTTLKEVFDAVNAGVKNLKGENRRFFSELLVNRMVFLKFVEKKGWLDGDYNYLWNKFKKFGKNRYWKDFLFHFFFEGLNTEPKDRNSQIQNILGDVPFLNAELFAMSDKWDDKKANVENRVFDILFDKLLNPYNFTVCETSPLDMEVAFNQDLLGYGYEELIADQHGQGAYYTHPTEVNLMCRESLRTFLETRCQEVKKETIGLLLYGELGGSGSNSKLSQSDALKLYQALHDVRIIDPALGSGTFPVAMMKHLFHAMCTLGAFLKGSKAFEDLLVADDITDPDDAFALKLHIIERSLYGCDIDYFAVQIAKLRFWIELMVDCDVPRALPNFDFKLVVGDALVSMTGTDMKGNPLTLEKVLGHPTRGQISLYQHLVDKFSKLKTDYYAVRDSKERELLRNKIKSARENLLNQLGVIVSESRRSDNHVLWHIDFADIFAEKIPGFDIAIANPPYLRSEQIDVKVKLLTNKTYNYLFPALNLRRKCDLYVYFYLRATMLLCPSGVTCFICSNSWLDIGYGRSLQLHFLTTTKIRGVYESAVQRSFSGADVNTIITVFENCKREIAIAHSAPFVQFKCPFSDVGLSMINEVQNLTNSEETENYKACIVQQGDILAEGTLSVAGKKGLRTYIGDKWGGRYLRAPTFFQALLNKNKSRLSRLGQFCDVIGYIHDNNTGSAYPEAYFLKTVKNVQKIWITKESEGVIRFGVRPDGNSRIKAPILFPRTFGTRHLIVWNPEGVFGKEFYKILPPKKEELTVMFQLISTFGILQREMIGATNLGDGALKFSADDIELFWILRELPEHKIMKAFKSLATRSTLDFREELRQEDRRVLDNLIFDTLELSLKERNKVYDSVERLISNRLAKAGSV
jgi:hypothetical protein